MINQFFILFFSVDIGFYVVLSLVYLVIIAGVCKARKCIKLGGKW